jgi:hypothetical protein
MRQRVRAGTMSAHKAAHEQIKAARARAKEIRHRTRTHRHQRAVAERQPSGMLFAIGGLTIVALVAAIGAMALLSSKRAAVQSFPSTTVIIPDMPVFDHDSGYVRKAYLVIPYLKHPGDPRVAVRVDGIIGDYKKRGFNVVRNEALVEGGMADLLVKWQKQKNGATDEALEDALEKHNLYGLLHITETGMPGRRGWDIKGDVVWSTRSGAENRLYAVVSNAPEQPYLLINDHPLKHDPEVESDITVKLKQYENRGWELVADTEMEAAVRPTMPTGPFDAGAKMPETFHAVMGKYELGGMLYVHAPLGEGSAKDSIVVTRIDAVPPPPEAVPEAPEVAEPLGAGARFDRDEAALPAGAA